MSGMLAAALAVALMGFGCAPESEHADSSSNPPMLIEPRVAVGKIHAGMRAQEVVAILGEPQRRTANALEYTPLGFAIMPGPDGTVQVVMCGDVTGISGPLVKRFNGQTKEGIGLKSTREEVLKAYGEPSVAEKMRGGTESLRYDSLGITFTLEGDKVYHMIVRLGSPPESTAAVTIDTLTTNTAK